MSRDVRLFLNDMVEAARLIVRFTAGRSIDEFCADSLLQSAIERQLFILGEAAKNVPATVTSLYVDVDWRGLARLRDLLAHVYFGVDPETLWDIATVEVPQALPILQAALTDLDGRSDGG